ncbi:fructuronate reductase/mannitol 2-dehydrogenase [Lentzea xinjiangensis]|uniref:Mannitol-1-phosphate 5-dehydrogenase n=1 Tax=Lentzea xinjiangensis TaxID=402600 RepID=A0A1H9VY89_9PSEU|nr:mannitol dehydrogenase family protein [Lentzea xinjiangensis]SES26592.1 fructuronate reductase/mannitol 2-dehydrogenase [Lentzea xinjiangensis]
MSNPSGSSDSPVPLNDETVADIADGCAAVPTYDRSALVAGVVHIGAGSFHRAHQAVYFDELARRGATGWGVVAVGVHRPEITDVLDEQDNLFTVVQRDAEGSTARVIGSVVECLLQAEQPQAVADRLADPRIRLVTLTITADGYAVDDAQGRSGSVFDLLVDALDQRRRSGIAPFTVLSCDNLPDNGGAARRATMTSARRRGPEVAEWIEQRVTFPDSMVDRITPSTTPQDRVELAHEFDVADRWPVITEPFTQWVVQDAFCNDRPPLDQVGVRYVQDVTPYKLIKSRLLNGTHCALGYLGSLAGYDRLDEVMADPALAAFAERLMREEVAPLLPTDVPGMESEPYITHLLDRFANPAISDRLSRLGRRGSTKVPDCVLPSLREARAAGRPRRLLTLAVAAWLRYLRGTDLGGRPIEVHDARAEELRALAERGGSDPHLLLSLTDIFGDLAEDEQIVAQTGQFVAALDHNGVQDTVRSLLEAR